MVFGHNGNRLIFPPLSSLRFHLRRELPTQGIKLINDRVYNNFPLKTLCDIIHSISDFYITTFPCINSSSQLQDDIGCVLPIAWDSFPTSFAKNFDPCFLSLSHSIFLQKQSLRFWFIIPNSHIRLVLPRNRGKGPYGTISIFPNSIIRRKGLIANCDKNPSKFKDVLGREHRALHFSVLVHTVAACPMGLAVGGWDGVGWDAVGVGWSDPCLLELEVLRERPCWLQNHPFFCLCPTSSHRMLPTWPHSNFKARDNILAPLLLWHIPLSSKCLEVMNIVETHLLFEVSILTSGISTFAAFVLPKSEAFSPG